MHSSGQGVAGSKDFGMFAGKGVDAQSRYASAMTKHRAVQARWLYSQECAVCAISRSDI
jgi:hypothetical protein